MSERHRRTKCTFCGLEHESKRGYQECRALHRGKVKPGQPEPQTKTAVGRDGSPITHYTNDPLRGDKRAHRVVRKHRDGWSARKIAKHYGLPLALVEEVLAKVKPREVTP